MVQGYLRAVLTSLALLAWMGSVDAECGVDQKEFNNNGYPQGYEGELYAAVRCYLKDDSSYCQSTSLPPEARGHTNIGIYYGQNISTWCTGLVTDFLATFYGMTVSSIRVTTG